MKIARVGIGKIAQAPHVASIAASADWDLAATVFAQRVRHPLKLLSERPPGRGSCNCRALDLIALRWANSRPSWRRKEG